MFKMFKVLLTVYLLGLIAVGGLSLVALGLVPWGIRAVALFTLLGLASLFLFSVTAIVQLGAKFANWQIGAINR